VCVCVCVCVFVCWHDVSVGMLQITRPTSPESFWLPPINREYARLTYQPVFPRSRFVKPASLKISHENHWELLERDRFLPFLRLKQQCQNNESINGPEQRTQVIHLAWACDFEGTGVLLYSIGKRGSFGHKEYWPVKRTKSEVTAVTCRALSAFV